MKGSRVATALGQLVEQRQEFETSLLECLTKFVNGNLLKTPTLELLQALPSAAGKEFSEWVLNGLSPTALDKTLKAVDPHAFKALAASDKRSHAKSLMFGRIAPKPKPTSTRQNATGAMAPKDILKLTDRSQQRVELGRLSLPQLKAAIKENELYGSSLSKKPSKTELIEHIMTALEAGWPKTSSILENSRY